MPNRWIEHVRQYAKDNNVSYACALSDKNVSKNYTKSEKKTKTQKEDQMINFIANGLKNKIKHMQDDDKPVLKMKFNATNSRVQELFRNKYSKYYNKLFS